MDQKKRTNRKAVSLLVQLKHPDVGTFAEEYATNLSPGGMFIRSRQPQPVGTELRFEVQIAGGVSVMRGAAVVRWARSPNDAGGAPGMGVEFLEVDDSTRALLDRMLERKNAADAGAAVLDAQLREQYGAPQAPRKPASPAVPPVQPLVPAIAPVVPPVARASSRPAAPRGPVKSYEGELNVDAAIADSLDDSPRYEISRPVLEDEPLPAEDEPLDLKSLLEKTRPPVAPGEDEVNISFEDLLASLPSARGGAAPPPEKPWATPRPVPEPEDAFSIDEGTPMPSALPPATRLRPGTVPEVDLDPGEGEPLELARPSGKPAAFPGTPQGTPAFGRPLAAPLPPPPPRESRPAARAPAHTPVLGTPSAQAQQAARPPPARKSTTPALVFLKPPEQLAGTGPIIGIDLGTTNSCVAVLSNGRPAVLRSKDGYNTIPSVVSINARDQLLVSHRAKSQMLMNTRHTIYGAKRLVGRSYDSATVRQVRERFHYEVVPDNTGNAAVRLKQHVLSLEEVQGLILRECKEMSEQQLNQKVERAVITVPAYYSELQREAVRKAGAFAGLKVERILNEPTAAALAYGLNRDMSKKVLVYDLGGGTFDATVLRIEKNVFEVLATGGDIFLGGLDFDNQIIDCLLEKFEAQHGFPFSGDSGALARVADAAERAKVTLSERHTAEIELPMLVMDADGKPRDLRCSLTRTELNDVCGSLVTRTLDVVRDVLLDAKLKATELDDVILVGGQSRMPLAREKLKELFGKSPQASVNADEAVALGAALYSGSVDKMSGVTLIDVLPMTIGVGMPGGGFKRVIERNTPLPAQRSFVLSTAKDNEDTLEISLFQGEDNHVAGNEYLGTVRAEGLPRAPKGLAKVAVTIRLDSECVLHVEARELSTRKEIKSSLATRYTSEELQTQLNYGKEQVQAAEEKREADLKARGGRFWEFLKKVIGRA